MVKNILIIGASSDLAISFIKKIVNNDVQLYLMSRNGQNKIDIKKSNIHYIKCDLSKSKDIDEAIKKLPKNFNIIVHCATAPITYGEIISKSWEQYEYNLAVQIKGLHQILKNIIPGMIKNGGGKIINVLTELVIGRPPEKISDYVTAKYALLGYSKCLAVEYGKYGITTNCISPGIMKTKLTNEVIPGKFFEISESNNPLRRLADVNTVADVIYYLCDDKNNFLNGENILINGGQVMH